MSETPKTISKFKTAKAFFSLGGCSETLIHVLDRAYDKPMAHEERATIPFVGGIKQHGYQCGLIWGAALSAGAQVYEKYGYTAEAETRALLACQKLVESFENDNGDINCYEITDTDKTSSTLHLITYFLLKGGTVSCMRRANRFAPLALKDIDSSLDDKEIVVPERPVSCAAELARRMGVSEEHQVMAAGLAGGIGLSGGACGAMGAAVWLLSMKFQEKQPDVDLWSDKVFNTAFEALMERFLKSSDYQFECAEIVGRKFTDISDHAEHMCQGGCSQILEALTTI